MYGKDRTKEGVVTALQKEASKTKNGRLELRLASQKKELLARAATVRGQSVSEFVMASALLRARKILATEESLMLSELDRDVFFQALENPPEATYELKKAFSRHKELVKSSEESQK
jgi:uncharacterized protein (DUF1778 family)